MHSSISIAQLIDVAPGLKAELENFLTQEAESTTALTNSSRDLLKVEGTVNGIKIPILYP